MLHRIAFPVVSEWCQFKVRIRLRRRVNRPALEGSPHKKKQGFRGKPHPTPLKILPMRASLPQVHEATAEVMKPWSNANPMRERRNEVPNQATVPKRSPNCRRRALRRKNWVKKSRWAKGLLGREVCRRILGKRRRELGGSERESKLASPSQTNPRLSPIRIFLTCLPPS